MPESDGRSWRREPLLHFLVLGGILFAVAQWRDRGGDGDADAIVFDAAQRERVEQRFESQRGRAPTDEERARLADGWIDEQLLYREGLRLGLDRGDPVIRRRVVEKMRFVAAEQAIVDAPDDATLQAFVDDNAERYAGPPRRDFILVTFAGDGAEAQARAAVAQMKEGAGPKEVGGRVSTGKRFTPSNTVGTYGEAIAAAVLGATVGEWTLVELPRGWSAVRVDAVLASETPALDKVRKQASLDWTELQRTRAINDKIDALRERYEVERPR